MIYGQPVHSGYHSNVYRGYRSGALVAIKRLKLDGIDEVDRVLERVSREARIWGELKHPNITPFLGYCRRQNEIPFLVSPWMENGNAAAYRKAHPEVDSLKLIIGVASGLEYLHSKEIVHGSLSAHHVLLDENLNAHLSDFSISRIFQDEGSWSRRPPHEWSAPEVMRYNLTAKSDIHSFASLAFELITGTWPVACQKAVHMGNTPQFPTSKVGNFRLLPNEGCRLWQLMLRCWKSKPAERPDIRDVVKKIQSIAEEQP